MTEIAIRDDSLPDSALVRWAYDASQAHKIAQSLAKTSFVPSTMKGKPDDITAAILAGQELGLQPMASLRSMDIIQGTPALRAHAMRGLVQSHGHDIEVTESTETRCKIRGRRKGSDQWQSVVWTRDRAEKLGLTGKDQWKKQPQTMLVARATAEMCRLIAADALYAMPYAAEELGDDLPASVIAPKRRAQRAPTEQAPMPEPEFTPTDEPEPEPEPTGDTPPDAATWDEPWPQTPEVPDTQRKAGKEATA